jgi:hypothetical protein
MSFPSTSRVTGGLFPVDPTFGPTVTQGASTSLNQTPVLNTNEDPNNAILTDNLQLTPAQTTDLQSIGALRNPQGNLVVPTVGGFASIGNGYQLGFDPNTLQGRITPALNPDTISGFYNQFGNSYTSYTGADVRLLLTLADPPKDSRSYYKQLIESTTITISIHREVAPVRAGGYINPKGFALGKRTIAGTLILTQFTVDVLYSFLQSTNITDGSKDTSFTKVDQLPPFNITMLFTNEYGFVSQRTLLGVKFVTDGTVYSIQDMMTEQTLSYMALDFTPLLPVNVHNLFSPVNNQDPTTKHEPGPMDLIRQGSQLSNINV